MKKVTTGCVLESVVVRFLRLNSKKIAPDSQGAIRGESCVQVQL
jgi:hypothetical protein